MALQCFFTDQFFDSQFFTVCGPQLQAPLLKEPIKKRISETAIASIQIMSKTSENQLLQLLPIPPLISETLMSALQVRQPLRPLLMKLMPSESLMDQVLHRIRTILELQNLRLPRKDELRG